MSVRKSSVIAAVVVTWLGAAGTEANTVSGRLWEGANGGNAIPANVPATPPDVTFDVNTPLNFSSFVGGYSIGGWLGSGGAVITSGAGQLGNSMINTIIDFTGLVTVSNGEVFHVEHDDGLTLIIGGVLMVNQPGPTGPANTPYTWTGASGTYGFDLVYGECCGAPAVLQTDLPLANVPEHGNSLALLGGAMTLLGVASLRLRK